MTNNVIIRQLDIQAYQLVLVAMQRFTELRTVHTTDEIWLVQHLPVFTQGHNSKEHVLIPGDIPVVQSDRGGKMTYHGPGQQVIYVMLDLRRRNLRVRDLITMLEKTVIITLSNFAITTAYSRSYAPGVYVGNDKICSIGLRIRNGCSLHGLALNIAMDLSPFLRINPCGEVGLRMTQLSLLSPLVHKTADVVQILLRVFLSLLGTTTGAIQTWHDHDYLL